VALKLKQQMAAAQSAVTVKGAVAQLSTQFCIARTSNKP